MRRWLAGVAAALVATAALPLVAAPAQAASARTGTCTGADNNAVTVVVDYQSLGGATQSYCVSNLASGATVVAALQATGLPVQGTVRDGLSFVCRINSLPGANQTLTLPSGQTYVEACTNTPPPTAYWSSWYAGQGGSWTYSSTGAATRSVVFGEYEGWSFSLGGGIGQAPAPRVTPVAWAAPPAPPPATTSAAEPAPAQPAPATSATKPQAAGQANGQAVPSAASAVPGGSSSTEPASEDPSQTADSSAGATPADTVSASPAASPSGSDLAPAAASQSGGFSWGTAIGLGLIVVIIAGAVVAVVIRRRRSRG